MTADEFWEGSMHDVILRRRVYDIRRWDQVLDTANAVAIGIASALSKPGKKPERLMSPRPRID